MVRKRTIATLLPRLLPHFLGLLPLALLVLDGLFGGLTANPIQAITQRTGRYALLLLIFSLACTPFKIFFGLNQLLAMRRPLGLYAFFYACLHFLIFSVLDYGLDLKLIVSEILDRRFILVGAAALIILTTLAITSFPYWQKRLGKRWKPLHRSVYLAAPLVVLHYIWAVKGNLFSLQGNLGLPLLYGLVVIILLLARLPFLKKKMM